MSIIGAICISEDPSCEISRDPQTFWNDCGKWFQVALVQHSGNTIKDYGCNECF